MAKSIRSYNGFFQGIADFPKTGGEASYRLGRSIDHRTDTRALSLNPKTIKESGSVVTDLPKWSVTSPAGDTYIYGDTGNIYKRTSAGSYSLIHTVPNSHGNGMAYFGEDDFIYYTSDKLIGRYGPVSGTPTFTDDFFGSQGGVRTNTNSLALVAASSQYASRADTSSLSAAGDITLETQIKPTSLPTTGNSMTLVSKWTENGNLRSYKFDITTVSNFFGDGSDGALTISANTTEAPIDSACTGTVDTYALTATNVNFAANQKILIHQTQGVGAGTQQITTIQSYTAGTITTLDKLKITYVTGAQVRVLKQYTNVTINSTKTWTGKQWNGTVGGIGPAFFANGTFTNNGIVTASDMGFRGNPVSPSNGEGTAGAAFSSGDYQAANGNGGGGAKYGENPSYGYAGGAGGGNGTAGGNGIVCVGGIAVGTQDLTTADLGGAGGSSDSHGGGGNGGGILLLFAATFTNSGTITSNASDCGPTGGGGGAGGSILIKAQTATLGTGTITASGGLGGTQSGGAQGATGGVGRIHIDYYTSYTGTTTPTLDSIQDNNLGTADGYILRLQISANGTALETYSKIFSPSINIWQHVAVTWDASASTAIFYKDAVSLGTQVGALTSISDNASTFNIGCYFNGTPVAAGFFNGLIDEPRIWSTVRTQNELLLGMNDEILGTAAYLKGYWKFNSAATDSTSYANTLTLTGSPAYSTDTPFNGATTRLDMDQSATTAGNTYTTPVAITESVANKKVFVPTKDPQKSLSVLVAAVGTGDWTITVHDSFDNTVASKTIVAAGMSTGYVEFVFSTLWRPLLNQNYHFHVTSTVNDGTVTTTDASDLSTVSFRTYYQFLMTDTDFHPIYNFLQFLVFGNERYIGTYEATLYDPHTITMPSGYKARCFGLYNEYLATGVWKGSTVKEYDRGRIFFWDGTEETYNFSLDVPEGAINAMLGSKGKLWFIAGYRGKLLVYEGGSQARKIKNLLNIENQNTIDVFPEAMTMWRALLRFGICGNLDDATIQRGVYTWGSVNDKYEESLSFDFPISTGTYQGNTVTIGLVTVVNSKLLIGWKDNISYGMDYIDISNDCYPTGTIEFLIEDDDAIYHQKEAVTITTQFEPLVTGQSIQLKYKLNRAANWKLLPAVTTVDKDTSREVISLMGSRYREYEIGVNLATSSTSPVIYGVSVEREGLETEKRVG